MDRNSISRWWKVLLLQSVDWLKGGLSQFEHQHQRGGGLLFGTHRLEPLTC